jgi:uncharacterized protein YbcC (UPF0753/DUF2309 family)
MIATSATQNALDTDYQEVRGSSVETPRLPEPLGEILARVEAVIPPLWPLRDYVAVNPFLGLVDRRFLDARQQLRDVRSCEMLSSLADYQAQFQGDAITEADLATALEQCRQEYPDLLADFDERKIREGIHSGDGSTTGERRFHTVSEVLDQAGAGRWTSHIIDDISRFCAAHYDQGQAVWSSPWKGLLLWDAWRQFASASGRMEKLGIRSFRRFVADLPESPVQAIEALLRMLEVPAAVREPFLLGELLSIAGWASFIKCRVRDAELASHRDEDLVGLLAIRLAYDVALVRVHGVPAGRELWPESAEPPTPSVEVVTRYVCQLAREHAFQRRILSALAEGSVQRSSLRSAVQMVFCIDVRSEPMRRHLEAVGQGVETLGFAGFFGMPLQFVPLGSQTGPAQCPVLLQPAFAVQESIQGANSDVEQQAIARRKSIRRSRKIWKSFQTSAVSCFSFVESIGLAYLGKILSDSLRLSRPASAAKSDGLKRKAKLVPSLSCDHDHGVSVDARVNLAAGMLRNLGLTEGLARIVAICGHASNVVNNPYRAGLDCGACGGHSGEPNARVAAMLLNDPQVRAGLAERGIHVSNDTWFVAAVHETTTDQIHFLDCESLPETHEDEFRQLQHSVQQAGELCRRERGARTGDRPSDAFRRSQDWSELRPEWGLAGNAAFIVAPRSRTAGKDLGGRTFLHSYDHQRDAEGSVLELIMTAPMVVASWINLQYYASTVDNVSFGSGSKTIHDVVGQLGVFQGNGGDLMTGLPWQSLHDGHKLQHESLRLLVTIEAPRSAVERIIHKHATVRHLVSNGWIHLIVLDQGSSYRWTSQGRWELTNSEA